MFAHLVSQIPVPVALAIALLVLCTPYLLIREALDRSKGATPAPRDVRKAGKGEEWDKLNKHHETHRLAQVAGGEPEGAPTRPSDPLRAVPGQHGGHARAG